jgi:hypothetical protein
MGEIARLVSDKSSRARLMQAPDPADNVAIVESCRSERQGARHAAARKAAAPQIHCASARSIENPCRSRSGHAPEDPRAAEIGTVPLAHRCAARESPRDQKHLRRTEARGEEQDLD